MVPGISVLDSLQVLVLAAAVPLSLVAARGFGDSPFGDVLRPLPMVSLSFLASVVVGVSPLPLRVRVWGIAAFAGVGTVAIAWIAVRMFTLVGERRRI